MNETTSIIDAITGNKPIGVEVSLETKSLVILATVIVITAIAIFTVKRLFSK